MSTAIVGPTPGLSADAAVELVRDRLLPAFTTQKQQLDWIDLWAGFKQERVYIPRTGTQEHKELADLARTPWLGLVVTTVAQSLCVDGYMSRHADSSSLAWQIWQANRMDARQAALHRAALNYGWCYELVLPGVPVPVMRGVSPREMVAVYEHPASDEWPTYALEVRGGQMALYDDQHVYRFASAAAGDVQFAGVEHHGVGVCPVVRFTNQMDLEGRMVGEVEPYVDLARRINKTAYDRMLAQHFNSWKVRYAVGIDLEKSEGDPEDNKLKLSQSDMLVGKDPTTRFGTLDDTPVDGFIAAYRSDIEALAAVSQTPAYSFTGTLVNLSADAITAARAPLSQKIAERKTSFGESHVQALRLAARLAGDPDAAEDFTSRATWQDMEVRSLAAAVDALGKAVQMLGVPAAAMWERLPGVTKADVDEWQAVKASEPAVPAATSAAASAPSAP